MAFIDRDGLGIGQRVDRDPTAARNAVGACKVGGIQGSDHARRGVVINPVGLEIGCVDALIPLQSHIPAPGKSTADRGG